MLHLSTVDTPAWLLLQEIFKIGIIKDNFALAGGTSLALQIGHRKSIDLDFFCSQPFDVKELETILSTQDNFSFEYIGNNSRMLFGNINHIKCDFIHEPAALVRVSTNQKNNVLHSVKTTALYLLKTKTHYYLFNKISPKKKNILTVRMQAASTQCMD